MHKRKIWRWSSLFDSDLFGELILVSEGGVLEIGLKSWVVITDLSDAVSEAFTFADRKECEVVVLSTFIVAGVLHICEESCKHVHTFSLDVICIERISIEMCSSLIISLFRHKKIGWKWSSLRTGLLKVFSSKFSCGEERFEICHIFLIN